MNLPFKYRELYAPAHFGNSYEVMWPHEMKILLNEAKAWGFNTYGDWFDFADIRSPYGNASNQYLLPQALWERKLSHYKNAAQIGMQTSLLVTPNHVFLDQLNPSQLATSKEQKHFGQLLCPSNAEAHDTIILNYRNLFEDFRHNEIILDTLSGCPYDYGGCGCDKCSPWIVTFGKLLVEIHSVALKFFPDIKARLAGWWWSAEEHKQFKAWADREKPTVFKSLASHIPYGKSAPENPKIFPIGCESHAFIHMVYSDVNPPIDRYGAWGPVVALKRLEKTVTDLQEQGYTGYMAYSEGVCDDVNKALLGGLTSGMTDNGMAILEEYAKRYFGASEKAAKDWSEWLASWSDSFAVDTKIRRKQFDLLRKGAKDSWRLQQWEEKLNLFDAHSNICKASEWSEIRLQEANRFFEIQEKIQRNIWGLGLVRHALSLQFYRPEWYSDWRQHKRRSDITISGKWFTERVVKNRQSEE